MVGTSLLEGGAMVDALHGILLGYDGSPGSEEALGWAAREARSRGSVLTACLAWAPGYPASATEVAVFARRSGERTLARGLRRAQGLVGSGEIRPLLADGPAASALCELSGDAAMVVVGTRGHGGTAGLSWSAGTGSVSPAMSRHPLWSAQKGLPPRRPRWSSPSRRPRSAGPPWWPCAPSPMPPESWAAQARSGATSRT